MRRFVLSWVIGCACWITAGSARAEAPPVVPVPARNTLLQSRRIGPTAPREDVRADQGSLLQVSLEVPAEWVHRSARKSAELPAPDVSTRPPVEALRPTRLTIMKSRHAPGLMPVPSIQASMPPRETLPPAAKTEPALQSAETLGGNLERTTEPPAPPLAPQTVATLPDKSPQPAEEGHLTITRTAPRRNLATRPPVQSPPVPEPVVETLTTRQLIMLREARQARHRETRIQIRQAVGYSPVRPSIWVGSPVSDLNAANYWNWRWHPLLQIPVYSY